MTKEQISQKLAARMTAILHRDYQAADTIRDELAAEGGIKVYDVKHVCPLCLKKALEMLEGKCDVPDKH